MEGYSGTREGGSGPTRRHSNTMTGRLQPHWPHPGGPDHNAVESSGRSYFKTFPKTRAACSKFALFLESKSRRPPRKISASSWHARSRQKLVTPIWLRQQQDFSTPRHVTMPSPFTHPGLQGNPLSTVWLSLDCALSESPPLLCPARDGSARPRTLGPGPDPGGDAGPGPRHTALWSLTRTGPPAPSALWSLTRTGPRGPSVRPLGHDLRRAVRRGPLSCPALLGASGCALLPLPTHPRSGWPPPSPHRAGRPS